MKPLEPAHVWEHYPEYHASQQYGRCLGRILVSLPWRVRHRAMRPLLRGAVLMANGIAGAHALVPGAELTRADREVFRQVGLDSVALSREGLRTLQQESLGDRANLAAAFELLERVEAGLRSRPLPV